MTTNLVPMTGTDATLADWQACAAAWLERKRSRSGSQRTATIYERTVAAFFAHCRKAPAEVLPQDVLAFATRPNGKNGKPVTQTTINHRVAVVSSFYGFATRYLVVREGVTRPLAVFNPASALDRATVQAYARSKAGRLDDIRTQIRLIPGDLAGLRDRAGWWPRARICGGVTRWLTQQGQQHTGGGDDARAGAHHGRGSGDRRLASLRRGLAGAQTVTLRLAAHGDYL